MLKRTFCHLRGIGAKTERRLWDAGVRTWEDLLGKGARCERAPDVREGLERSLAELDAGNAAHFGQLLPVPEMWRLCSRFRDSMAYVDIETTGTMGEDHITSIALYDGRTTRTYVHGRNLSDFEADIHDYKVLVTFNGRCFDVPYLERHFRTRLPHAHIDLRFVLKGLGHRGGLKKVEKLVGLDRNDAEGLDGYFAVLLWKEYERTGSEKALETLLCYNVYDVLSLELLLVFAFNQALSRTPFAGEMELDMPREGENPHFADPATVLKLRERYGYYR